MSYVREEDKILSRKNIGSAVYKDARRESLDINEVNKLYRKILRLMNDKKELLCMCSEIDKTLSGYAELYNMPNVDFLMTYLKVKGAKDV